MLPDHDERSREVEGIPSTATLGGHPIHPVLVPFPLVFLSTVACTDLAYLKSGDPFWSRASGWLLRAGIASGAAAGIFGAADWLTIGRARSRPAGKIHAAGNVAALGLALASLERRRRRRDPEIDTRDLALSAGLAALLGVTGWLGGELSYRHGIGVIGEDPSEHAPERSRGRVSGRRDGGYRDGYRDIGRDTGRRRAEYADAGRGHEEYGRATGRPADDGNPRWGRAQGVPADDGGVRYGRAPGVPVEGGHSRYGRARGVAYEETAG
jgi:uncharacterized membrane protein